MSAAISSAEYNIRPLLAADWPAAERLYAQSVTELMRRDGVYTCELFQEVLAEYKGNLHSGAPFFGCFWKGKLVGTIALTPMSALIQQKTRLPHHIPEVSGVYVLPAVQRKGVGRALFAHMMRHLQQQNIGQWYLDSGYPSSQRYWTKHLGPPDIVLPNQWGEGAHHMVWRGPRSTFWPEERRDV